MKNRVIYGALLIVLMACCIFLSPITRVLFFAAGGCLCAWAYPAKMTQSTYRRWQTGHTYSTSPPTRSIS